jgi:hypothetical protein
MLDDDFLHAIGRLAHSLPFPRGIFLEIALAAVGLGWQGAQSELTVLPRALHCIEKRVLSASSLISRIVNQTR